MKKILIAIIAACAMSSYAHPPKHGASPRPPARHSPMHGPVARPAPRPHSMPPPHSVMWNGLPKPAPTFTVPPPRPIVSAIWISPVYETRPVYDQFGRFVGYQRVLVSQGYWQY